VRLAVLFGSVVSGETRPHSDVDIVAEFEGSVTATDEVLSLIQQHSILVSLFDDYGTDLREALPW
jgi:predicted nucleotidyltransferase